MIAGDNPAQRGHLASWVHPDSAARGEAVGQEGGHTAVAMVVLIARDRQGRIVDVRLFPGRQEAAGYLRQRPDTGWSWEAAERCPGGAGCPCRYRPVPLEALTRPEA